jgi:hypothetical protein
LAWPVLAPSLELAKESQHVKTVDFAMWWPSTAEPLTLFIKWIRKIVPSYVSLWVILLSPKFLQGGGGGGGLGGISMKFIELVTQYSLLAYSTINPLSFCVAWPPQCPH